MSSYPRVQDRLQTISNIVTSGGKQHPQQSQGANQSQDMTSNPSNKYTILSPNPSLLLHDRSSPSLAQRLSPSSRLPGCCAGERVAEGTCHPGAQREATLMPWLISLHLKKADRVLEIPPGPANGQVSQRQEGARGSKAA